MEIANRLLHLKNQIPANVELIAVSKTHSPEDVLEAYKSGQKAFGENKVQELMSKADKLPDDISWHLIGHLQSNKVKYIAPFVHLIHSVDSLKLLKEIDKQGKRVSRIIKCLIQVYIAQEETKFGLTFEEAESLIRHEEIRELSNVNLVGLMGIASLTENQEQIRREFKLLNSFYCKVKSLEITNWNPSVLSMGMSSDFQIAIAEGSNMVRIGSGIFGSRDYMRIGH